MSNYGADPRDCAMLAFGGAGPMTACMLAEELGVNDVLIPPTPGVLSALGGLIADLKNDFIKTVYVDLDACALPTIHSEFETLREQGTHWLRGNQDYEAPIEFIYSADMRYRGQSFEVETFFNEQVINEGDLTALAEAFHDAHFELYSHADRQAPVQIVNLRLVAVGHTPKPTFTKFPEDKRVTLPEGNIRIYSHGTNTEVALYRRENLRPGNEVASPSVVAQEDTTICITPGFTGRVDGYGNLLLHKKPTG